MSIATVKECFQEWCETGEIPRSVSNDELLQLLPCESAEQHLFVAIASHGNRSYDQAARHYVESIALSKLLDDLRPLDTISSLCVKHLRKSLGDLIADKRKEAAAELLSSVFRGLAEQRQKLVSQAREAPQSRPSTDYQCDIHDAVQYLLQAKPWPELDKEILINKILIYSDGWNLHRNRKHLVAALPRAQKFGPACEEVAVCMKLEGGSSGGTGDGDGLCEQESKRIRGVDQNVALTLDLVFKTLISMDAKAVSDLSRKELPWLISEQNTVISESKLAIWFAGENSPGLKLIDAAVVEQHQ